MPDYGEINDIAKNPARARSMAQYLLKVGDVEWTDWEIDFLEATNARKQPLSTRHGESMTELRDAAVRYREVEGFARKTLIAKCWLGRDELDSARDVEFIERLRSTGAESLRKRDAV